MKNRRKKINNSFEGVVSGCFAAIARLMGGFFSNKMGIMKVREKHIRVGVRNLKEFGYSNVNPDTILTDTVFAAFFKSMLKDNLGNGDPADRIIHGLIAEIDAAHPDR